MQERDHVEPPLQGYRLHGGKYRKIRPRQGRLPSDELGLHLERQDNMLRLWNPRTKAWLPTPEESRRRDKLARESAEERAESAEERAEHEAQARAEAERRMAEEMQTRKDADAERERMRKEIEELHRRLGETKGPRRT